MNHYAELDRLLIAARETRYDLADPASRAIADGLTRVCWSVINGSAIERPLWLTPNTSLDNFVENAPHFSSRIYEAVWLSLLSDALAKGGGGVTTVLEVLREQLRDPRTPARSNLILQAAILYRLGEKANAKHLFSRATAEFTTGVISPVFSYARSVALRDARAMNANVEVRGCAPTPEIARCLLTAGDSSYVARYLTRYIDSIAAEPSSVAVHLEWMRLESGSADDSLAQEAIDQAHGSLGTRFTHAEVVISSDLLDMRTYYASHRFLAAGTLLPSFGIVILTDLDYQVCAPLDAFISRAERHDICANRADASTLRSFFPWLSVTAGTVAVRNTPVGRWFLSEFAEAFRDGYYGSRWNWGIDQNILSDLVAQLPASAEFGNLRLEGQPFEVPWDIKGASR